jgi:hypothetical protein
VEEEVPEVTDQTDPRVSVEVEEEREEIDMNSQQPKLISLLRQPPHDLYDNLIFWFSYYYLPYNHIVLNLKCKRHLLLKIWRLISATTSPAISTKNNQ